MNAKIIVLIIVLLCFGCWVFGGKLVLPWVKDASHGGLWFSEESIYPKAGFTLSTEEREKHIRVLLDYAPRYEYAGKIVRVLEDGDVLMECSFTKFKDSEPPGMAAILGYPKVSGAHAGDEVRFLGVPVGAHPYLDAKGRPCSITRIAYTDHNVAATPPPYGPGTLENKDRAVLNPEPLPVK